MADHRNDNPGHSSNAIATAVAAATSTHAPAAEATIAALSEWLDTQLAKLEAHYRHNTTHQSAKRSLGRK